MARPTHDFLDFINQASTRMQQEYNRIQKRAREDPGTAGDQGEENWKALISQWVPANYHVVTKGRLLNHAGEASPQVDVLVLHPSYPVGLLDVKLYMVDCVAAAFECKITLRPEHIKKSVENAKIIRRLLRQRRGTPYRELWSPLIYGLLAHSHCWKGENSTPEANIERLLHGAEREVVEHPREMLDVICISDLCAWYASKTPFLKIAGPDVCSYHIRNRHTTITTAPETEKGDLASSHPIVVLIRTLMRRLAYEDPSLRGLSHYLQWANLGVDSGGGDGRGWNSRSVYSSEVLSELRRQNNEALIPWDEWRF